MCAQKLDFDASSFIKVVSSGSASKCGTQPHLRYQILYLKKRTTSKSFTVRYHSRRHQRVINSAKHMPSSKPSCCTCCCQHRSVWFNVIAQTIGLLAAIVFGFWAPMSWQLSRLANLEAQTSNINAKIANQLSIINFCVSNEVSTTLTSLPRSKKFQGTHFIFY